MSRTSHNKQRYLLMDSKNMPIAKGILECPVDAPSWQIRVLDNKAEDLMDHETLKLMSLDPDSPNLMAKIIRRRNDIVILEKFGPLGLDGRRDLRMPTRFNTFIYPVSGSWPGRRVVISKDLSCSGIAFYCREELDPGEQLEVVIPITSQPLILHGKILQRRDRDSLNGAPLYAVQFYDMCDDERSMVREAVFNVQLQRRTSVPQQ